MDITSTIIEKTIEYIKSEKYLFIIAVLILLCLLLLIQVIVLRYKKRKINDRFIIIDTIDDIIKEEDYEKKLKSILRLISSHIDGNGYFLYLYEEKNNRYRLESVMFKDGNSTFQGNSKVEVGYGRLIAYEKETYSPQIAFENAQMPDETSILMDGRFSILILPVLRDKGFITVSVKHGKKYIRNKEIVYLKGKLKAVFASLVDNKIYRELPIVNIIEEKDEKKITGIMDMALLITGADAGIFMSIENDYCELKAINGFSLQKEEKIINNIDLSMSLVKITDNDEAVRVFEDDPMFEHIPDYLKENAFTQYLLLRPNEGIFIACYNKTPEDGFFIEYRMHMVKLLMAKLSDNYSINKNEKSDEYYNKELDVIVRRLDDEEPYSVGYSDLISRYAIIIAKEMHIETGQTQDIQRAAFLSNIGVLAVPESVLRKKGLYDKAEYELVKGHSEHGAFIAKLFTRNDNVANYIMHHHERIDGKGYPLGLEGDEIPIGSRIIGALQSFLSKIKGRNYREPMPFDKIITFMRDEEGKSLDKEVVHTLIDWFKKKQDREALRGKPLGSCWEMQCSSEDICQKCPAYLRRDKFCWEFEENNCQAHGNSSCDTCFVYTEYLQREKQEQENEN